MPGAEWGSFKAVLGHKEDVTVVRSLIPQSPDVSWLCFVRVWGSKMIHLKKCGYSMISLASFNLNLSLDCSKVQWEAERKTMFRFLWAKSLGKGRGDCYSFLSQSLFLSLTLTRTAIFSLRATETTPGREIESDHYQNSRDSGSRDWMSVHILCLHSLLLPPFLSAMCGFARFRRKKKEMKTGYLDKFEFQTNEE